MYVFTLGGRALLKDGNRKKKAALERLRHHKSLCAVRHASLAASGVAAHANSIRHNLYRCGELQLKLAYYQRVLLQHNLTLVAALVPQYFLISTDAAKNIARADNSRGSQKRQFTTTKAD